MRVVRIAVDMYKPVSLVRAHCMIHHLDKKNKTGKDSKEGGRSAKLAYNVIERN
jgi:hypothetical protein